MPNRYLPETAVVSAPSVVSRAGALPVSIAEMKRHLRIMDDMADTTVRDYILAARDYLEDARGLAFTSVTLDVSYTCFPGSYDTLELPVRPLQSLTSIGYVDTAGDAQTWTTTNVHQVADNPIIAALTPKSGYTWPSTQDSHTGAVTIRYVAGWGDTASTVPERWKQAIKFLAAHWYDTREALVVGTSANKLPYTLEVMLANLYSGRVVG